MAGASPHSDWLRGCVALDQQGFILTGRDLDPILAGAPRKVASWSAAADA
jgi:hypothetical protein